MAGSFNGDDTRRFLQERDEVRSLYSNVIRDLGQMDFHLNVMQDTLTILEYRASVTWARLAKVDARIVGKSFKISFFYNFDSSNV